MIAQQLLTRYCGRLRIPADGTLGFNALMRVIFEGSQESLDAYKALSGTDRIYRDSDEDEEYIDSDPEVSHALEDHRIVIAPLNTAETVLQNAIDSQDSRRGVPQRLDEIESSWVVVDRLNNIASDGQQTSAPINMPIRQNDSTPFWSPSPITDNETTGVILDVPSEGQGTANEWDMLDDIDFDFTEGLGSAFARKVTRAPAVAFDPDEPVESIEQTPNSDTRRG